MNTVKLSDDLNWRGLIKDKTFADDSYLDTPKTFYLGADVGSSDSLTIGNLAIFMLARRLLEAGWTTYLLVGGATSLIGDPGGKEEERELVSVEQVEKNKAGITKQVERLFAGKPFVLVDNLNWFKGIHYLEFLRDVGKHFSMTELTQREFIRERIGEGGTGISYAEFSYSLIQGYDFWHLFKEYGVTLQIGGSDQWGNMLSGVPLIRKKESAEVHALSMPLTIDKTTGKKFGKSESGAIWLDDRKTSVYTFYQFWLNVDDEGVVDYLKVYTFLSRDEIDSLVREFNSNKADRLAQKTLAYEVTRIVHGKERAESVKKVSEVLFGQGDYQSLQRKDFEELCDELPVVDASDGHSIIDVLVRTALASSNSDARRFLQDNAVYINGQQIPLSKTTIDSSDSINGYVVIRRGKNSLALVRLT